MTSCSRKEGTRLSKDFQVLRTRCKAVTSDNFILKSAGTVVPGAFTPFEILSKSGVFLVSHERSES